jgi:CubicO group peptidase (beta-lactamase class C family)
MTRVTLCLAAAGVLGMIALITGPGTIRAEDQSMMTDDPSSAPKISEPAAESEPGSVSERGLPLQLQLQAGQLQGIQALTAVNYGSPWQARHGLTSDQYQAEFNALTSQGYRLTYISGYTVNGQERFAALFEKNSGPGWVARHGMNAATYQSEFNKYTGQGYRLILVNGYTVNNQDRYVAIWEQGAGPAYVARHGMTSAEYQSEFNKYVGQGYRLVHVSGYAVNNSDRYAAIWVQKAGPPWVAKHGMTSAQYQTEFNNWTSQGYRLVRVSGYGVGNQDLYAAIWEKAAGPSWVARHGMSSPDYQGEFNNYYYQGYRLEMIDGYTVGNQDRYAAIWHSVAMTPADLAFIDDKIQAYTKKHSIPGMSIAVVKDGRLVFAKGYGYADTGAQEKVNPAHLFRIASVSKPMTSIAIMKLIEEGNHNITLGSKVFGDGAILGKQFGTKPYSDRLKKITIEHLLTHTSGLEGNDTNGDGQPDEDWMFMNYNLDHNQNISWVLDNRTVLNEPGTAYQYLNFGYSILGRVIETITGQNYETYMRNKFFIPSGSSQMQIGGDSVAARKPNEVLYYQPGGAPYDLKLLRMDAHGGWIASPIDLLRVMVRVDQFPTKPDILKSDTITSMWTATTANMGYAKGWGVDATTRNHNGAMSGTVAFLVRRSDGLEYAFTCNTRPSADGFASEGKSVMDQIMTGVKAWPTYDLF